MRRRALLASASVVGGVDFTPIEYLTFDGTKIFNTNIYGNNSTSIYIKFKRSSVTTPAYLFGCDGTSTTRLNAYLNSNGYWRYGNYNVIFNTRTLDIYEAEITPGKIKVNNTIKEFTPNVFTTSQPLSLGGYTRTTGEYTAAFKGYIYYFRILIDGVLVADWIPVLRSDGVECFFDNITQSFITPVE